MKKMLVIVSGLSGFAIFVTISSVGAPGCSPPAILEGDTIQISLPRNYHFNVDTTSRWLEGDTLHDYDSATIQIDFWDDKDVGKPISFTFSVGPKCPFYPSQWNQITAPDTVVPQDRTVFLNIQIKPDLSDTTGINYLNQNSEHTGWRFHQGQAYQVFSENGVPYLGGWIFLYKNLYIEIDKLTGTPEPVEDTACMRGWQGKVNLVFDGYPAEGAYDKKDSSDLWVEDVLFVGYTGDTALDTLNPDTLIPVSLVGNGNRTIECDDDYWWLADPDQNDFRNMGPNYFHALPYFPVYMVMADRVYDPQGGQEINGISWHILLTEDGKQLAYKVVVLSWQGVREVYPGDCEKAKQLYAANVAHELGHNLTWIKHEDIHQGNCIMFSADSFNPDSMRTARFCGFCQESFLRLRLHGDGNYYGNTW